MKIELKSKDLVKVRKELKKQMEKFGEEQKGLVKLSEQHQKTEHKINRLKEKGLKMLDKVIKEQHKLDEFDYFVNYEAKDDELLECQIQNVFDDAFKDPDAVKERLRNDKKNGTGMWSDKTMYTGHV